MALTLAQSILSDGGSTYYTEAYQTLVETHLQWLLSLPSTTSVGIVPGDAYKYEGDLTGLLLQYNVPVYHHYVVMRMNDMRCPTDYKKEMLSLYVPDSGVMSQLDQIFNTTFTPFGS
jgi:hypothetical protein